MDAEYRLMTLVLSHSPLRVENFLRFNRRLLEGIYAHLNDTNQDQLKNFLHTLKGNSRTFGLPAIANTCHQLEDLIKAQQLTPDQMAVHVKDIETGLQDLERASETIHAASSQDHSWLRDQVQNSLDVLRRALTAGEAEGPLFIRRAAEGLATLVYRDLQEAIHSLKPSLDILAQELKKPVPHLVYQEEAPVYIEHGLAEVMQSALVHILSNSMIHGIESADDRRLQGKSSQGTIRIETKAQDHTIIIMIADDGRGFSLDTIHKKAVQSGLLQPDDTDPKAIADTIFAPGLSTAREVSLHAGRGVGMTAVRTMIQDLGGRIEVQLPQALHRTFTDFQPLAFVIQLPRSQDQLLTRVESEDPKLPTARAS